MTGKENDLDETRRLLYMALLASRTKKYNLAGTLVNALRHHSNLVTDDEDLERKVILLIDANANPDLNQEKWARGMIAEICGLLALDGAE